MLPHRKRFLQDFLFRWFVSSLGLFIAAGILGGSVNFQSSFTVIVVAGLILALINTIIKPIVVLLSFPILIFSFGLFMIVINGLMVLLASRLYDELHVTNFFAAMLAGMIIGLVNYLVVTIVE
ncbi:MAG TPA: phage holin family protein [Candidatus Saccharimonadales bacterium]|nr:phage holin family protein [Candidatus Saccharimonadales bacterium]